MSPVSATYPLSSCIEWQFTDAGDLAERLRAAKAAGLELAEFHLWRDKPIDAVAEALAETGMRLTGVCVDPRRSIVDPAERAEMVTAVRETIAATEKLGKPALIVASGFCVEGLSEDEHFANAVAALREAADVAEEAGVTLLLEPLNTRLFSAMYLVSTKLGLDLVEAVDSPNLRRCTTCGTARSWARTSPRCSPAASTSLRTCRWPTWTTATSRAPARSTGPRS